VFGRVNSLLFQLLIRVKAAGVNPVDTYIRQGAYSGNYTLPLILGFDAAGIVEKVGGKVQRFKVGCIRMQKRV
jgi:NADPH2:quinone reductase